MKKTFAILLVLAILALSWWLLGSRPEQAEDIDRADQTREIEDARGGEEEIVVEEIPNALEGELQASNDRRRGNLMLLLNDSDRVIYLNTSRDFSSLIGKQVSVSIEGSLDDFRLIDIVSE